LKGGQNRVVPAARAPADLLVGLEVLRGKPCAHTIVWIASAISPAEKGFPRILL